MFSNANVMAAANALPPQPPQNEEFPWILRVGSRAAGCVGGVLAIALGIWTTVGLSVACLIAGVYLVFAGFILTSLEAPCCCMFIEYVNQFSQWADSRPPITKAIGYAALAIPDLFLCFTVSTFFASFFIFIPAVLYGIMALGKKADRSEMMARASSVTDTTLVDDRGQPHDLETGRYGRT